MVVVPKNRYGTTRGGPRPNSGRPKGHLEPQTIEKNQVIEQFRQRVARNADRLLNAQLDLAIGEKYLMVKTITGKGKDRKTSVDIVTDVQIIKDYIDNPDALNSNTEVYFMTTKPANNFAIQGLLDRTFGKSTEKIVIDVGDNLKAIASGRKATDYRKFIESSTAPSDK